MDHESQSTENIAPIGFVPKKIPQFLAAGAAALGGFSLGAILGWSSPALSSIEEEGFKLSDNTKTWVASIVTLAACLASPIAGFCIEKIGRKMTLISFAPLYVTGWLIISFAKADNTAMLMAGRFITGICGGTVTLTSPIYINEISTDALRAILGSMFMVMIILGTITTYGVGAIVSWKWMSLMNAFPPAILLFCIIWVPDSPVWLIKKGKAEQAKESLKWLRGATSDEDIEPELQKIRKTVEESSQYSVTLKDLFGPQIWRPTAISMMLVFFNQFSGIQAVLFYASEIVESTNSGIDPDLAAVLLGVAVIFASAFMEKAGRRTLLLISEVGMTLSFAAIGTFFYLKEQNDNGENPANLTWLPIVGLVVYIMSYACGLGPLPRIVLSEILPIHVKGLAASVAWSFNWLAAFAVTKTFEDLRNGLNDSGFFFLYSGICFIGIFFIYFTCPETRNKSYDEIQMYFNRKK